jgi:hypothetical protein
VFVPDLGIVRFVRSGGFVRFVRFVRFIQFVLPVPLFPAFPVFVIDSRGGLLVADDVGTTIWRVISVHRAATSGRRAGRTENR